MSLSKCITEKVGGKVSAETQNSIGNRFTIEMVAIARIGNDKRELFDMNEQLLLNKIVQDLEKNRIVSGQQIP